MKNVFLTKTILLSLLLVGCSSTTSEDNGDADFLSKCSNTFARGNYCLKSSLTSSGIDADLSLYCFYENDFLLDAIDQPTSCSYELNLLEQDRLSFRSRGSFSDERFIADITSECSDPSVLDGTKLAGHKGATKSFNCELDFHYRSLMEIVNIIYSYKNNFKGGVKNVVADSENHILSTSYFDDREYLHYQTSVNFVFDDDSAMYWPISIVCTKTYEKAFSRNGEKLIQVTTFTLGGSSELKNVDSFVEDERIDYFSNSQIQDKYTNDNTWFSYLLYKYLIYNKRPYYIHR